MLCVVGPRLAAFCIESRAGDRRWGARLFPAACRQILGFDPATLRNRIVGASQIPSIKLETLERALDAAQNMETAIVAFDAFFLTLRIRPEQIDRQISEAVRLIEVSHGRTRMSNVAAAVNLRPRSLQRRFLAAAGLTPKQFARTRRLRAVAAMVGQPQSKPVAAANWLTLASETGFADQAHLTRELLAMTGQAPVSFARELASIERNKCVR